MKKQALVIFGATGNLMFKVISAYFVAYSTQMHYQEIRSSNLILGRQEQVALNLDEHLG